MREIVYCLSGSFQNGRNITVLNFSPNPVRFILVIISCSFQVPVGDEFDRGAVSFDGLRGLKQPFSHHLMGRLIHYCCLIN